jgi:hypothetical protein
MTGSSDMIHIVILKGSVRPGNYTSMAAALVEDELKKHSGVSVETIDPGGLHLPLPGTESHSKEADQLRQKVTSATGIVLATPEYNGGRCLDTTAEQLIRGVGINLLHYIEQNVCPRVTLERLLREEGKSSPYVVGI